MSIATTVPSLLALLADGKTLSRQTLCKRLGLSDAELHRVMKTLSRYGLEYELTQECARLCWPVELVEICQLQKQLPNAIRLHYLPVVDSTQQWLKRLIASQPDLSQTRVTLTDYQFAGQGRRGRCWHATYAGSILLSMRVHLSCEQTQLQGFSLACGVEIADTIEAHGSPRLQLKWPNDLLLEGRKLGGLLIETAHTRTEGCDMLIGIGINLRQAPSIAAGIDQPWNQLHNYSKVSRNALIAAVIRSILRTATMYPAIGFQAWQERWNQRDAYRDSQVKLDCHKQSFIGVQRGVSADGAMLLQTGESLRRFYSGEAQICRAARFN